MDYNSRLKPIRWKGLCGDPETVESAEDLESKVDALAAMVEESRHTVIFTGAGISTSCGISDFRGPDGVWTREQKGEVAVDPHNAFNHAIPSFAHNAIACLLHAGIFTHLVSQNVDGLHLRSGVSEAQLSELHGNIFKERCTECGKEYMRDEDVGGMGLKPTGRTCDAPKGASSSSSRISTCGGVLVDMAVDWDTTLPAHIFKQAHAHMDRADVVICLGSSLRIHPAGNMPLRALKPKVVRQGRVGKVVVVNLQKTHLDKKCLKVNHYCDEVMRRLCGRLGVQLDEQSKHPVSGMGGMCDYSILQGSRADLMLRTGSDSEGGWREGGEGERGGGEGKGDRERESRVQRARKREHEGETQNSRRESRRESSLTGSKNGSPLLVVSC